MLATLVALIETQTGSQFVVKKLANYLQIEIGEVRGSLARGLDIDWIQYQHNQQSFATTQVSFRWNSSALLYNTLSIESLSVDSLNIQLPESADKSHEPFSAWPNLKLPIRIQLKKFRLNNIQFTQGDYQEKWQRLSGSLGLGTFHLRYSPLILVHDQYRLRLSGKSDLHFPYDTSAALSWIFLADTEYQGKTKINGSLENVITQTQMKMPLVAIADIRLPLVNSKKELINNPSILLKLDVEKQYLPQAWWPEEKALPLLDAHLQATGYWDDYSGNLQGNLLLEGLPAVDLSLTAKGNLDSLVIEELQLVEARKIDDKPLSRLQFNGQVHWSPTLKWDLSATADELDLSLLLEDWPTNFNASLHSVGEKFSDYWLWKIDDLNVQGNVRDLAFSLAGNLHQNKEEWRSQGLQLIWGANRLDLNGYLADQSKVIWNLQAPMLNQIDNQFSGSLSSKGNLSGSWSLPQMTLEAKGEDLSFGDYALKQLDFNLTAINVAVNKTSIDFLSPKNASQINENKWSLLSQDYQLQLTANQLQVNQDIFKTIQLAGSGSLVNHQLKALVRHGRLGKLEFNLDGKLTEREWQGKLKSLALKIKKIPKWWLSSSQSIVVNKDHIQLRPLCFTTRSNQTAIIDQATQIAEDSIVPTPFYANASPVYRPYRFLEKANQYPHSPIQILHAPELCVDAEWQSKSGLSANVDVNSVPLRQFYSLFKPEVFFAGVMDGYLRIQSSQLDLLTTRAQLQLETRNAELRYQYEGGLTEVYPWDLASISSQLSSSELASTLKMDWTGFGNMQAELNLALDKKKINKGHLGAKFNNLEPLETLLPFTDNVKGQFNAELNLQGNFEKPQLSGDVKLSEASARIPKLGLSLDKISVEIFADNSEKIDLKAVAVSGDGDLDLQGALLNPLQNDWHLTADLGGKNFQIINLLTMKANINPAFTLSANSQLIKLTGEAEVPKMRANIKTLPQSAVQVSEDVVIVDGKTDVNQSKGIPLQANLRLRLGEDVKFTGFGLDSQLSGDVKLIKEPLRPWLTNGYVAVKEGSYQAYGQALSVERGRLIFQGDYENPGLDINAFRMIDDDKNTKVTLEISGSLQKPKANIYSDPATSDSNAMMMLLTGKPLSEASKADASILITALGGMGVQSSQGITQEIAQFFGVDELSIKSDKGIEQSQLWVGKYVTPKILVRYVVGLFDQAFSLGVVYRLTDKVRVEAESGETQSVDVIYRIER